MRAGGHCKRDSRLAHRSHLGRARVTEGGGLARVGATGPAEGRRSSEAEREAGRITTGMTQGGETSSAADGLTVGKPRRFATLGNRFAVWRAARGRATTRFVGQPEPRSIGLFARGRQLVAGNYQFAGLVIREPDLGLWEVAAAHPQLAAEAQGFLWLDDLAALGDHAARNRAQEWVWGWIAAYGQGQGPGWTPDLTGRRLIRCINHALFLLSGKDRAESDAYFRQLTIHTLFLARRWRHAAPGLPRFEALTGLVSASLALSGMERHAKAAVIALGDECTREIDAQGGIPTRNPAELLEVFTLLTWAERALSEAGQRPPPALVAALQRIAPTLRALRHSDGGLARFHGGGRGMEGRLDQALALSGVKPQPVSGDLAMGFARLQGGRSSVVVDAAAPPDGAAGRSAHASTLAFELTSGRRPLIVSCGSGAPFGADWWRAGRATASHSTVAVDGFSSSRLDLAGEYLIDRAQVTLLRQGNSEDGAHLVLSHNGWSATHGLAHVRELTLSEDGRWLTGVDKLAAITPAQRQQFEQLMTQGRLEGVRFALRFHLHPDVDAALDLGGTAISLALKSGEIWVFRHNSKAALSLTPSVYLEKTRLKPRPSQQIVLSGRAMDLETAVGWTLAKAQDTPRAIRDLGRDDMPVPG